MTYCAAIPTLRRMELHTPQEVARILKISVKTVQRLRANGKIEYYLIGNKPRYSKQHIDKYLEDSTPKKNYVAAINGRTTVAQREAEIIAAKQKARETLKKLLAR